MFRFAALLSSSTISSFSEASRASITRNWSSIGMVSLKWSCARNGLFVPEVLPGSASHSCNSVRPISVREYTFLFGLSSWMTVSNSTQPFLCISLRER
jgi:hypothetical protein